MKRVSNSPTEVRLLRRLQWRMALGFAAAFLVFDLVVVGLTYVVLDYHFTADAKAAIGLAWQQQALLLQSRDPDEVHPLPPRYVPVLRSDEFAQVVTWQFNRQNQYVSGSNSLYGLPIPVSTVLPDATLLSQMRHTRLPLWQVIKTHPYRVLVGSKPLWRGTRFVGAEQSVYSMGRVGNLMAGLLIVDLELSVVAMALIMLLAFWLSGRALVPIRQAIHRQRDFIHDVSHELRTPLTLVKSGLELALGESERADVDQAIRTSLQEVDYVTRLMSDLATLARIDSGTTLLEPAVFDVWQLAQDVVDGLTPLARERRIALTVETLGEDSQAMGDPVHIRQLLLILLDNALKYNHPGGSASLTAAVTAQTVKMVVQNTGPAIPPEDLPHVFDRFYRSRSTNRLAPGSGVGLAIAKWIAESHNGQIRMEGDAAGTTRVIVEWPRHQER